MDDDDDLLTMDGWDDCWLGVCCTWDHHRRVRRAVYDGDRMVQQMVERDGCTAEEAEEYILFNCEGAYVGPATPIIVWHQEFPE